MRLITIKQFAKTLNVRDARGYELARRLPPGVRVELGRQIRINEDRLAEWIEAGGTLAGGNASQDPDDGEQRAA